MRFELLYQLHRRRRQVEERQVRRLPSGDLQGRGCQGHGLRMKAKGGAAIGELLRQQKATAAKQGMTVD